MSAKPLKPILTPLEQAEATLAIYQWSVETGHPWLPGSLFLKSPGLDQHIKEALESWVEKNRPAPVVVKKVPVPLVSEADLQKLREKKRVNGG